MGNFKTRLESEFILSYFSSKQNISNLNQASLKCLIFFSRDMLDNYWSAFVTVMLSTFLKAYNYKAKCHAAYLVLFKKPYLKFIFFFTL